MDTSPLGQEYETVFIDWIRQNAIPLQHIEAGNGFDDLQFLKTLLRDVRVVGLGESTHGTSEIFQMKHRLVEFLVTQMGFTAFAIEASFAACQPINAYILHGIGEPAAVLTGQGYIPWDTEEFSTLLDWMRTYNQSVPEKKQVRFYGLDIWRNEIGRSAVLDYLRRFDPQTLSATEALFQAIAVEEDKWPRRVDAEAKQAMARLLPQLQDLINALGANRERLAGASSPAEFAAILHYAALMKQFLVANAGELLPEEQPRGRSLCMFDNLMWLVEQAGPDVKFMIWAHDGHVRVQGPETGKPINMGYWLRETLGRGYFALSLQTSAGSYRTRMSLEGGKALGDLEISPLPTAPAGAYPWYFSRARLGKLLLNLREVAANPAAAAWLSQPHALLSAGWVRGGADFGAFCLASVLDGVIYIDPTTATHPTENALKTAAQHKWL